MSISKHEITDAMRRAIHREPALRQPTRTVIPAPQRTAKAPVSVPAIQASGNGVPDGNSGAGESSGWNITSFSIVVPCIPPAGTAQQKGVRVLKSGKLKFFTKGRIKAAKKQLIALFANRRPAVPFQGPIRVTVVFVYPWRKTEKKEITENFSRYPIAERPDIDNRLKGAIDVLTECRYWNDDAQISTLIASKYRGDSPCIELSIEQETGTKR